MQLSLPPSNNTNVDGRSNSCVSLAFRQLGIPQDMIEVLQTIRPIHKIPYPTWLTILERCSHDLLEPYDWHGTLQEFIQQHPTGKFLTIIEVTSEEDVSGRQTHAVAITDGMAYNVSNTGRSVFKVWKVIS